MATTSSDDEFDKRTAVLRPQIEKFVKDHLSPSEASDFGSEIVSTMLMKIWSTEPSDEILNQSSYWLMSTRHLITDYRRQHGRRTRRVSPRDPAFFENATSPSPIEDMILREQLERVMAALPSKEAKAIKARYLEGLTQEQAAETLGIPVWQVKLQCSKAMQRLRRMLNNTVEF